MTPNKVEVKRHVRRRTERAEVDQYARRRPAAVPRWTQTSYAPGREAFRGRYKSKRLYVSRAADGSWYWSVRKGGKDAVFIDSTSRHDNAASAGEASRKAEFAAGYEYAGQFLNAPSGYCPHGTYIGTPGGPDLLCARCETAGPEE